jgi:hypothetical protein
MNLLLRRLWKSQASELGKEILMLRGLPKESPSGRSQFAIIGRERVTAIIQHNLPAAEAKTIKPRFMQELLSRVPMDLNS